MFVPAYLAAKAQWSRLNDWWMRKEPRAPLPCFASPQAAWGYLEKHGNPYTGDPLGGIGDCYLHPERFQYALESADLRAPIDCDDAAGWLHLATRTIPGHSSRVVTLLDAGVAGSHVICVGEGPGGAWAIDGNGYRALPDLDPATLCCTWTAIYRGTARYVAAYETPYPW